MPPIRFGLIGAGHLGVGTSRGDSFIRLLSGLEDTVVTAVFDINPDNATRAAARAEARAFTALEPFLDSGIEAVIICSPVRYHTEQAVAALERGLHVLSEVPAVHSMEAAYTLVTAAVARPRGIFQLRSAHAYREGSHGKSSH